MNVIKWNKAVCFWIDFSFSKLWFYCSYWHRRRQSLLLGKTSSFLKPSILFYVFILSKKQGTFVTRGLTKWQRILMPPIGNSLKLWFCPHCLILYEFILNPHSIFFCLNFIGLANRKTIVMPPIDISLKLWFCPFSYILNAVILNPHSIFFCLNFIW